MHKQSRINRKNNFITTLKQKFYKPHYYNLPLPPPSNSNIHCEYHYKGDRKYANVKYLYPIDDNEIDRMQEQHYIYHRIWKNNFSAPVKELLNNPGTKVLDVGCGPGIWTLEVATDYPDAKFTGIDIAPTYPINTKPHNVEFLQKNILHGLPFEDNTFDYVFCRFMIFSFTVKDWKFAIEEISRVCKIGGYIEFMEKDIAFENEGMFTKKARSRFAEELRRRKNVETVISPKIREYLTETDSFPMINHEERKVPIGQWGGEIGYHYEDIYKWGAKNLSNIMKECGYDEKEWDLIVENCIKELSDNHGNDKIHRIWAKKEVHQQV